MNHINRHFATWILACFFSIPGFPSSGQVQPTVPLDPFPTVKGDTLDGLKYFIRIVPHDTTTDEKMPLYRPDDAPNFVVVDQAPVPIRRVQPTYPENARREKIEGTVWLVCLVGKDGTVQRTKVDRADADVLVEPAVEAAKRWLFSPAKLKGKAVDVWVSIPFRFKLDK